MVNGVILKYPKTTLQYKGKIICIFLGHIHEVLYLYCTVHSHLSEPEIEVSEPPNFTRLLNQTIPAVFSWFKIQDKGHTFRQK